MCKIIIIDGLVASGKSTSLNIIKKLLKNNFHFLLKYSTRLKRVSELKLDFVDSKFLTEDEFKNKTTLIYQYSKAGATYAFDKEKIETLLSEKVNFFLIGNEFMRKSFCKDYGSKYNILQIYINAEEKIRELRILQSLDGKKQTEQRIARFKTNKKRDLNDFKYIVDNNNTISSLNEQLVEILKKENLF